MDYLKESFRLTSENSQYKEKMKKAVADQTGYLDFMVRPSLTEIQNENLTTILENIVTVCSDCSFRIGYNEALQSFADAKAMTEPNIFPQQ